MNLVTSGACTPTIKTWSAIQLLTVIRVDMGWKLGLIMKSSRMERLPAISLGFHNKWLISRPSHHTHFTSWNLKKMYWPLWGITKLKWSVDCEVICWEHSNLFSKILSKKMVIKILNMLTLEITKGRECVVERDIVLGWEGIGIWSNEMGGQMEVRGDSGEERWEVGLEADGGGLGNVQDGMGIGGVVNDARTLLPILPEPKREIPWGKQQPSSLPKPLSLMHTCTTT